MCECCTLLHIYIIYRQTSLFRPKPNAFELKEFFDEGTYMSNHFMGRIVEGIQDKIAIFVDIFCGNPLPPNTHRYFTFDSKFHPLEQGAGPLSKVSPDTKKL